MHKSTYMLVRVILKKKKKKKDIFLMAHIK